MQHSDSTPDEAPKIRLFVAVNLPAAVKSKLSEVQQEIALGIHEGTVRWTRSEQIHITLKFLGYVPETDLPQIQSALRAACAGASAMQLGAEGLGCFPSLRSPRVIWVGMPMESGIALLLALQKQIEAATARLAEPEKREFTPHLTLGRVKEARRRDLNAIAKFVEAKKALRFGQWRVEQVDLMQSVLSPHGPTYTCLCSVALD